MKRLHPLALGLLLLAAACGDDDGSSPDGSTPGRDGGGSDGGPAADGSAPDLGTPMPTAGCAERSAAIVGATGETITVSPAGDGEVMVDGSTSTLRSVVSAAAEGTTILLEDGTYVLPEAGEGSYTGLYFTTPNVTLRSASGDAGAVVIDSAYRLHGGGSASITIDAPGVTIANLTVRRSVFHLVHLWEDGDDAVIHDVRLVDGGQQLLKASPGDGAYVDRAEVSCSTFAMTSDGRANVWGYGPSDGSTTCYTGGIDTHGSRDWHIHDSRFEGIYCDDQEHPAHGQAADQRGGMTYTGGLAEHAIHMWESESGSGHTIERNTIVDCARGIGVGLRDDVYGAVIRNNAVFSRFPGSGEHDVGIILERAHDSVVDHNTVFFADPDGYANAIEIRWGSTSGVSARNNLTNRQIRLRDGADATMSGNVTDAMADWFVDAATGDLHLAECPEGVSGASDVGVSVDLDGDPRGDATAVGADHCE